jgi:hypothetical protein
MNAKPFRRPRHSLFLLLAVLLLLVVGVPAAQAAVWTDQLDYAPGSVVTISGDNVGLVEPWAVEAEVTVKVAGPLDVPYGPLAAYVGMDGTWSCQFTLSDDPVLAVGGYTYVASAAGCLETQSGTFTDANTFAFTVTASPPGAIGGTFRITTTNNQANVKTLDNVLGTTSQAWTLAKNDDKRFVVGSVQQVVSGFHYSGWSYAGVNHDKTVAIAGDFSSGDSQLTLNYVANHAPTSNEQAVTTSEDTPKAITLTASDADSDPLTWAVGDPSHGTLTGTTPNLTYTPAANYNGPDSFTFKVNDGTADSNTATVSITVTAVNDGPLAKAVAATTDEDTAKQVTLDATDVDGDALTYEIVAGPSHGSLGTVTGNKVTYTPAGDYNGSDTFTYKAKDAALYSNTATVSVTVNAVNDAPTIGVLSPSVTADEGSSATNTGTWGDVDGDNVVVSSSLGAVTMQPLKSWSWDYTPPDGPTTASVFLSADDQHGGVTGTWFALTVNNVAPTVDAGADATIDEGSTFSSPGSFTDPGADTWSATVDYGDGSGVQPLTLKPDKSFDLSHPYADNGEYTVTVTVTDDDGSAGSATPQVTVSNVAPSVGAAGAATVNEGSAYALQISVTDPGADAFSGTVDWGDGNVEDLEFADLLLDHTYLDDGVFTVTVTVTDDDGGVGSAVKAVMVQNVAPTLAATGDANVDEGSAWSGSGSVSDPGADTLSGSVDYGDGTTAALDIQSDGGFTLSHVYADGPANYTVTLTAKDSDDAEAAPVEIAVEVKNVAPTVAAGDDATIDEGGTFAQSGSFSDPGADTWSAKVDYGDGSGEQALTLDGKDFDLSHTYVQDGAYDVVVSVSDDDTTSTDTVVVTVRNVAPTLSPLALSGETGAATVGGNVVGVSFSFTDPGANDKPWTIDINWGDGKPHTVYNAATQGAQSPSTHTYAAGTYTLTVKVTDKDGGSDSRTGSVSHLYSWTGFFSPVDMGGVFNVAKAGSAIPVKFSLGGNFGLDIFASLYPRYARVLESGSASEDTIEETVTAGNSSLSYSGNQYVYVWKTEKSLAGTCQQLQVKLMDGTIHTANFRFK